jgi:hypothetical protein
MVRKVIFFNIVFRKVLPGVDNTDCANNPESIFMNSLFLKNSRREQISQKNFVNSIKPHVLEK